MDQGKFGRNEKGVIVRSPNGLIFKDYEKLVMTYREAWEESKFLGVPYVRTVARGSSQIVQKIILNPLKKVIKETGKIAYVSSFVLALGAHGHISAAHDYESRDFPNLEVHRVERSESLKCKISLGR